MHISASFHKFMRSNTSFKINPTTYKSALQIITSRLEQAKETVLWPTWPSLAIYLDSVVGGVWVEVLDSTLDKD